MRGTVTSATGYVGIREAPIRFEPVSDGPSCYRCRIQVLRAFSGSEELGRVPVVTELPGLRNAHIS